MANVRLEGLSKEYGSVPIVENLNLEIKSGELVVLLGPSGCGKTTTLRMVAGFIAPTTGAVYFDSRDVTALPPRQRNIGMVFQDYSLFPNMTIAQNISFGLRQRGTTADISSRVSELLELIELPEFGSRYPSQLSGGQKQRVALARALAYSPQVLLMDEPFGSLDLKLRRSIQSEFHQIQQRFGTTTIMVTHDQEEAMVLGDRIVLMSHGRIQQIGTPEDIYLRPLTPFAADFIGKINSVSGRIKDVDGRSCVVELEGGLVLEGLLQGAAQAGDRVLAAIRPEALTLHGGESSRTISGIVKKQRFLGNLIHYTVEVKGGHHLEMATAVGLERLVPGMVVQMNYLPAQIIVFREDGDPARKISDAG